MAGANGGRLPFHERPVVRCRKFAFGTKAQGLQRRRGQCRYFERALLGARVRSQPVRCTAVPRRKLIDRPADGCARPCRNLHTTAAHDRLEHRHALLTMSGPLRSLIALSGLLATWAYAQPALARPDTRPSARMTPADVATFFNSRMPKMLKAGDVAGAVVVVVRDGRVIHAKGYGYASLGDRRAFTPETMLRPGSITKLFTWIAVLQLVERGRLDLDRDVNAYLDFRIPPAFGKPITLRNLMTHTAGFEEVSKDLFVSDPSRLYPLGTYLKRRLPARIFPPGKVIAYSNYGSALAGYIVERAAVV